MPKLSQKSFVSGQYDRIAQNQESINGGGIVASGLSYAKNILSSDKGELRKRLGTKFLKQLDGATVIVPFRNKEDDNILLFAQNKLDILEYKDDGVENFQQQTDTKVEKTWTSDTVDGYTVSVPTRGTSGNAAHSMFVNPYYPPASGSEGAAHPFVDGYEYLGNLAGGGIYPPNSFYMKMELPNAGIVGKFSVMFATTHNEGAVPASSGYTGYTNAVIQYSDDDINWTPAKTIITSAIGNTPYFTWRFKTISGGIDTTKVEHLIIFDAILNDNVGEHLYWRIYFTNPVDSHDRLYSQKVNIQFYTRSLTPYATINTDITNLKNIKYAQSGNDMKLVDGEHTPKTVTLNAGYSYSNFTPSNPGAILTGATPSCVQYFQNRLWFGGFSAYPTTVIASKFNNIDDFRYSTPAQTDDGLELKCNQLKSQISNLISGQNILYCFSQDGISNIDGASNGLATNSSVEFVLKNRMPAGDSTPAFKDDVMLYSSSDGTKLYGVDFDLLVNRFQVSDLAKYAKDITKAKITELHYVNNESKLVYGLMEDDSMFALLYEKGQYQGFFPLDFNGTVYDIAPIKVGRNYKLLMVVFRDGNWYLEEKLDMGNYIDTSTPRLTSEEKKWATYDNLENNIALDCYQTYDEGFDCESRIDSESTMTTNTDLTEYIDKTIMLSNDNSKEFAICSVDNVELISDWTPVNTSGNLNSMGNIHGLAYINDKFVAVGQSFYAYVSTSTNGIDWAEPTEIQSMELRGADSIAYNGSVYVLIGTSRITTSTDLVNWTTPIYDADMAAHRWLALSANNGTFFAVSTDGYVSTSTDGTTWTTPVENTNLGSDKVWRSVAKDNSKFVLLGNEGDISVSTDGGSTWTESIRPYFLNGKTWRSITYDGTKFIALSEDGCFSTSSNGIDWSEIVLDKNLSGNDWILLAYGNSKLVALKEHDGYYSVNQSAEISSSYYETQITIQASRGSATTYTKIYPEFTEFTPNLPQAADVAIIAEGRYFDNPDVQGNTIYLPAKCYKVVYGLKYESVAIIKLQAPYESLKNIAQVDLSVIDSTHLEVGTNFDDTQNIEKIDDSSYYDLTRVTMNDTYRLVLSDTPETTKNLILRSNKGVPFTVIAIDMYINYSNLGGD